MKTFQAFPTGFGAHRALLHVPFGSLGYIQSIPKLLRILWWQDVGFFSNAFSTSEMTQLRFSFILLRQEAYWCVYIRHPYFSGRNPDESQCGLTMCWHLWFGSASLRSSASVFIRYTRLEFCLRAGSLSASQSRVMLLSDNEFRNVPAFNF